MKKSVLFITVTAFMIGMIFSVYTNAQGKKYKIGQRGPGGGIVFYDKGVYSNGWRYLEIAPEDQGRESWACSKIEKVTGIDIGTGRENTDAILSACGNSCPAASMATSYRGGGKNDWFLPSIDELQAIYENLSLTGIVDFQRRAYWSSTNANALNACVFYFNDGTSSCHDSIQINQKDIDYQVRAIRSF